MKQKVVKLDYNGKEYISDPITENNKDYLLIDDFITKVADCENRSFSLKCGNKIHHFPVDIVKQSIITIIEEEI